MLSIITGTYKSEAYDSNEGTYSPTSDLAIQFTVEETFDNDQRVITQTTISSDEPKKFTFTAAESGLHRLCFRPDGPATANLGGWFSNAGTAGGGLKLTLDMAIGESSKIESDDKNKIETLATRVKELNGRLLDIRREQVFQRVRRLVTCWLLHTMNLRLTKYDRNEKPSFEIRVRQRILGWSAGRLFSWECWA